MNDKTQMQKSISVGSIIIQAIKLYKNNFGLFLGIVILGSLPTILNDICDIIVVKQLEKIDFAIFLILFVFTIIALFILVWSWVALPLAISQVYLGNTVTIKECFIRVKGKFWRFIGIWLLYGLIIFGGSILLIIPGIYYGVVFSLAPYIVIFERKGEIRPLEGSRQFIKGNFWKVFLLGIVLLLLTILFIGGIFSIRLITEGISPPKGTLLREITWELLFALTGLLFFPFVESSRVILYYTLKRLRKESNIGNLNFK